MIAKLRGSLDSFGDGWVVLDVGGVGYLLFCSGRTLGSLPPAGQPLTLLVETVVREDHIHLFGFEDAHEREWFRLLQTVQSVGARLALAILSALPVDTLAEGIASEDKAMLTRAPGVGPKLATRLITELKDKVSALPGAAPARPSPARPAGADAEAIAALVNLGYRPNEAHGAVASAARALGDGAAVEALIRDGLKELAS